MSDEPSTTANHRCKICGKAASLFCIYCESNFFCADHACGHLAREQLGTGVPNLKSDNGNSWKTWLNSIVLLIGVIAIIGWLFSDSNGTPVDGPVLIKRGFFICAGLCAIGIIKTLTGKR